MPTIYRTIKIETDKGIEISVLAKATTYKWIDYEDSDGRRGEEKESVCDVEICNLDGIHDSILKACEASDAWFYPEG